MKPNSSLCEDVFRGLPPEWPIDPLPEILRLIEAAGTKVIVLDDDPTGTQTVHDVAVLTYWSIEALKRELLHANHCFFILTNSRSLAPAEARKLNLDIARSLKQASEMTGRQIAVISRGDSTLRGHFPLETDALNEILGPVDGVLLIPFYEAGRRYTIGDIHFLAQGEILTPVGETEFARDNTFGYRNSHLPSWVEEKSEGRIRGEEVASISIEIIRRKGPEGVCDALMALAGGRICVANIASIRDLRVFIQGVLQAEARGKKFLYRTAASFAAARAGIMPRPLLNLTELTLPSSGGGLIVVGSYVPTTSRQLRELLDGAEVACTELNAGAILDSNRYSAEVNRAAGVVNAALERGRTIVLYTSRDLVLGDDSFESLAICRRVAAAVVDALAKVSIRPRYMIVKGGITSSGVAMLGLNVHRATVLGQICPGVPVWRCGEESRWPGLAYVSFPGNFGGPEALKELVEKLEAV